MGDLLPVFTVKELGPALRELRTSKGKTLEGVTYHLSTSVTHLSLWERSGKFPSTRSLFDLLPVYGYGVVLAPWDSLRLLRVSKGARRD